MLTQKICVCALSCRNTRHLHGCDASDIMSKPNGKQSCSHLCWMPRLAFANSIHFQTCPTANMQKSTAVFNVISPITTRWQTCLSCAYTWSFTALYYDASRPHISLRIWNVMQDKRSTSMILQFWASWFLWKKCTKWVFAPKVCLLFNSFVPSCNDHFDAREPFALRKKKSQYVFILGLFNPFFCWSFIQSTSTKHEI